MLDAFLIALLPIQPIVAILHTFYAIAHLSRSFTNRAPRLESSYMLYACVFDSGLIPFYVFTAVVSYGQYAANSYHWGSLLGDNETAFQVTQATFILSVVNAGFHLVSLGVSIFLTVVFHKISRLPPDANPLEDNLTARPHMKAKSEISEKHRSKSTVDSADPLIDSMNVSFAHLRDHPFGNGLNVSDEKRQPYQLSYMESVYPRSVSAKQTSQTNLCVPQAAAEESRYVPTQPIQAMFPNALGEGVPAVPNRGSCVSPDAGNWVTYPSRSPSPANEAIIGNLNIDRNPSSAYSRSNTTTSTASNLREWLGSAQRYGRGAKKDDTPNCNWQYATLTTQESYANDEKDDFSQQDLFNGNTEHDLGDHRIDVFPDNDGDEDWPPYFLPNPLAMNPPTPQPPIHEYYDNSSSDRPPSRRLALNDFPNFSGDQPTTAMPPVQKLERKGRFYGEVEENPGFFISSPRSVSIEDDTNDTLQVSKKRNKLAKRASAKTSAYTSVNQDDNIDGADPINPVTVEGDRKGRVVSNSGADIIGTAGSRRFPYGDYIANLGVGRRRDVSGKIAEEGRSLNGSDGGDSVTKAQPSPIRAPGWARFAGL